MALTKINNNTLSAITGLPAGVGGKVLQVVSTTNTGSADSSTTTIVEFMNLSITPSSASSKIMCFYQCVGYANGHNNELLVRLYRGTIAGTQIASTANSDGGNSYEGYSLALSNLDSPSTTSAQQYTIGFGATQNLYHAIGFSSHSNTLTLMEIAG
jgi:hypothetical protein